MTLPSVSNNVSGMSRTSGLSGRLRRRRAFLTAAAAISAAALVAGPAIATSTPATAPAAGESTAPAVAPDNPRPSSCPAVPSNQGAAGTETQSATGVPLWPPPPTGANPEDYAAYLHTAAARNLLEEIGSLPELPYRFVEIDNVNLIALFKDERLHLWIPTLRLMSKMNTSFQ